MHIGLVVMDHERRREGSRLPTLDSGETNVPISGLGAVHDNPSSAEAIYAAKADMVVDAQNPNADNGEALRNVARAASTCRGLARSWTSSGRTRS